MKSIKCLVVIATFLCLSVGLFVIAKTSNVAYASTSENGFNEGTEVVYESQNCDANVMDDNSSQSSDGMAATGNRSGTVKWIPFSGAAAVPLRRVRVELWNGQTGYGFAIIAAGYSGYDGTYSITYNLPLFGGDYSDLSIIVYPESDTFRVIRDFHAMSTSDYRIHAKTDAANLGDSYNLIYSYETSDRHKAFYVSQGMVIAQRYAIDVGGMSTNKKLAVLYPVDRTSFCWNVYSGIDTYDYDDIDTLMHEYAHFVEGVKGFYGSSLLDIFLNGPHALLK